MVLPAIALLVSPALADRGAGRFEGPDHTEVDLLRVAPDGPRIYVQAEYPDGSRGLFLVDTGANVSLLSESAAERLGLSIDAGFGSVVGLGGTARMDRAVVPSLRFGDVVVPEVEVAVGVPGMSPTAGAMELDGLLGNNVWSRFTLEIDYPADTLVLHRPGTVKIKRNAGPLVYDGSHVFAPVEVRTARAPDVTHAVVLRVDTGAGDLSLCGKVAEAFDAGWSEGLEPILGLGASETLPPFRNLQTTRHLELAEVRLAGKRIPDVTSARWMSFRGDAGCPDDMRGLAGHHLLSGHRVLFDYQGGHLQLSRSHRKARSLDGHAVVLAQEQANGATPERAFYRALLALQLEQLDLAEEELRIASEVDATRDEALVLLARVDRFRGRPVDALDRLLSLAPGQLVDHEEIVGTVNGLLFEGRSDEALAVAREAVASRPEAGWAWVALADVLLVRGEVTEAEDAILQAVAKEGYPDAHLLRRARIALASGDRLASMAHVRRLLHLYPMGGEFLWFYAMLVEEVGDRDTFESDLDEAMARLHPDRRPLDFLVAAQGVVGFTEGSQEALSEGVERDCTPLDKGAAQDNCLAWYWSLANVHPDESLVRIERALAESGDRSDYLDTLAMVRLARGELAEAATAAREAARLAPDSVYILWQAERIGDLADDR